MSNLDEDLAAFDKMLGIEPEAAPEGTTAEPEAPVVDETPPVAEVPAQPEAEAEAAEGERPRDEQGRFAKADETAEAQAEKLLAGKFKSPAELEQAYTELQSRLGQQGSELGDLRSTLERLNSNLERAEEPEQAPVQVDSEWFEENLEENPSGLAQWATEHRPDLLPRVMKAWGEVEPYEAATFVFDQRTRQIEQNFERKLAEETKPYKGLAQQSFLGEALTVASAEFPDIINSGPALLAAAKFSPEVAKLLDSPDADERVKAVKTLYYLAGGMGNLQTQATAEPAAEATPATDPAQAASDAKLDGSVATQTQSQDAEQKSEGEKWLEEIGFDSYLDKRSPVG